MYYFRDPRRRRTGLDGVHLAGAAELGTDERLKGTIHGQVFFAHKGKEFLALAQPNNKRILITDGAFGTEIHAVPASHFNDLFDEIQVTPDLERLARAALRRLVSGGDPQIGPWGG